MTLPQSSSYQTHTRLWWFLYQVLCLGSYVSQNSSSVGTTEVVSLLDVIILFYHTMEGLSKLGRCPVWIISFCLVPFAIPFLNTHSLLCNPFFKVSATVPCCSSFGKFHLSSQEESSPPLNHFLLLCQLECLGLQVNANRDSHKYRHHSLWKGPMQTLRPSKSESG